MLNAVNPYIAGSPVTGPEMFFGREDVFTFIRQALIGKHRDNIIVLYGQRRTGKTSTLYQLPSHLGPHYVCVFVDLQALHLEGIDGSLWELANHIQRILQREHQIELPHLERQEFMADARSFFRYKFLDQVWSAIGDRHLLLMLDEAIRLEEQVRAGKLEHQIFEYMSHLMQHYERLNFLFSLGSGLEEMEKEYTLLFRTAVYKKISFLNQDTTNALITNPVKDCYGVEDAAQERIFQITSGHPYCIQLLCHNLFNRWQRHPVELITVLHVEQVLDEAVERGLAVFKHIWEESTPAEKAVMAAISEITGDASVPVSTDSINQAWKSYKVRIPQGEMAQALKNLIARDVIKGEDTYVFCVDLQRLWIQKYRRFDWVAEEIAETMHVWATTGKFRIVHLMTTPTTSPKIRGLRTLLLIGLILILTISGSVFGEVAYRNYQQTLHINATATAQAKIASTYPFSNKLELNDPLIRNNPTYGWDDYQASSQSCFFSDNTYHNVDNTSNSYNTCATGRTNYSNFTFEVEMVIIKGDNNAYGGLIFRAAENSNQEYVLSIDSQGNYQLFVSVDYDVNHYYTLLSGSALPFFTLGLNHRNTIGVVVNGSIISLYVNHQRVTGGYDSDHRYSSGQIGFVAGCGDSATSATEVTYTNAKVWQLAA